tara:strand:+ start:2752 stop:3822 length:1071 start_codon:yes stop_codon:yes gene_type:complete
MNKEQKSLIVENLSLNYDDNKVLRDINFDIKDSEILALVGPSGSGKTSLIRCITGLQNPNEAIIKISENIIFSSIKNTPIEKRDIGIVFQDFALFPHMTVEKNIQYGMNVNDTKHKSLSQLSSLTDLMLMTGISHLSDRYPDELSGGEQQRVALARSLAPRPKILLMDEPFSNLDPNLRIQLRMEVRRILKYLKISCLFVTHDQQEALYMGDRIIVLNEGEIQQIDENKKVFQNPSNQFVAEFIGLADFIDGEIKDKYANTELGKIEVQSNASNGETVNIMLRPDDITITKNNAGNGFVVQREYRGMYYIYYIKLNSGKIVKSLSSHTNDFNVGTKVDVELTPGHPLICYKNQKII